MNAPGATELADDADVSSMIQSAEDSLRSNPDITRDRGHRVPGACCSAGYELGN